MSSVTKSPLCCREIILLLAFLFFCFHTQAQVLDKKYRYIISGSDKENFSFQYFPGLSIGTHINQLSYTVSPACSFRISENSQLQFRLNSEIRCNERYLGIEGSSLSAVNKITASFSSGEKYAAFANDFRYQQFRKHNFRYYYTHYASTDKTNQLSGGIEYTVLFRKSLLSLKFEDDFLAFLGLDEFRTGAASVDYKFIKNNKLWGIGVGATLWTGSTKGLSNLDNGQVYDMSNQYGADYSHGILFLNLHYQFLTLSVGYDSDNIRTSLQNTIHEWIDDGIIQQGSLAENKFYAQLKIYAFDALY